MQVTLIIYVSMRKISLYPPGILLLFSVLLVLQSVFTTTGYVAQSVNDQPTNPTRPRSSKISSISYPVQEQGLFPFENRNNGNYNLIGEFAIHTR